MVKVSQEQRKKLKNAIFTELTNSAVTGFNWKEKKNDR